VSAKTPLFDRLDSLAKEHGSSFYLFYPDRFLNNLEEFKGRIADSYPNCQLAFALKANYMPQLCSLLHQHGFWGEAVSDLEYEIAREYLPGSRLILNGPCKSETGMKRAFDEGALVNLDSFYEIGILESLAHEYNEIPIGLRVNFDIETGPSRFGFNFENGDFRKAVARLGKQHNVRLVGVHSHFTTKERSLELFDRRAKGMMRVYESLPQPEQIRYINLGGGFFGPMTDATRSRLLFPAPTFAEYASVIAGCFAEKFGGCGPCLVLEPGVSVVADAMDYVVRILDERQAQGVHYLTVDGSISCLFPTGSRYTPAYSVIRARAAGRKVCNVVGYTCMEHDVLMSDVELEAEVGDFIVFHNRGAYSNVYKPPFIKGAPAIIGVDGMVYARRQTCADVIAPYAIK
jgi:diaminopimelate decarboxylase